MKNWEKCPLCNGSGMKKQPYFMFQQTVPEKTPEEIMKNFREQGIPPWQPMVDNSCEVCKGQRIINSLTGHPPKERNL